MLLKKYTFPFSAKINAVLFLITVLLLFNTTVTKAQGESTKETTYTFYIPNAFTPNGDGINDTFFGKGEGISQYDIWIFDRWGALLFHGKELNDGWNGKATGGNEVLPQGVYIWKVILADSSLHKHSYLGTVTLVK